MRKLLRKPSPAMTVACLALFVASTGTSIAASHYLITSTNQIKPSVLTKLKGAKGPKGATGAKGADGQPGMRGIPGISGLTIVQGALVTGAGSHTATAACPTGKKAIGGGFSTAGAPTDLSITTDAILSDGVTNRVDGHTGAAGSWNLVALVYCATVQT
ncbi:MAG: collagen-like protein [Gaiellaceae bacterium]|jgi:hypothetical protein